MSHLNNGKFRNQNYDLIHLEIAKNYNGNNKKSLIKRNTGMFYTPSEIGIPLIKQILKYIPNKKTVSIIDPFCGDGRLITWLLENSTQSHYWDITIWDYDGNALEAAHRNISIVAKKLGVKYRIRYKRTNTFDQFHRGNYEASFDVVVTNPPWDVIKPDAKELSHLDSLSKKDYVRSLKQFSERLLVDYPTSKPNQMYGGWGINLARVGTELAIRLARSNGVVGIVSPASLFADQNSSNLRRWLFENNHCKEVNYFPAECKLFSGVDQASVSFILIKGEKQNGILLTSFDKNIREVSSEQISIPMSFLKTTDHKLPISFGFRSNQINQLVKLQNLPLLQDLDDLWSGRELDETNNKSWLTSQGKYPFLKGRMIDRFSNKMLPSFFLKEVKDKNIPQSVNHHRLVWRDVSRPSQKRRLIATLIPPNWVTGNSLGVAYFKKNNDKPKLLALLGVISSLIFEFQIRSLLATAHVSVGVIRKARIPDFSNDKFIDRISELVEKRLEGNLDLEKELEISIAKAYGLDRNSFAVIVEAFPKIDDDYKTALLNSKSWSISTYD